MSRKPDYWVKALDKSIEGRKYTAKVGAAWDNPDGSISIDLNPFVVLTASPNLVLTLFPCTKFTTRVQGDEQ